MHMALTHSTLWQVVDAAAEAGHAAILRLAVSRGLPLLVTTALHAIVGGSMECLEVVAEASRGVLPDFVVVFAAAYGFWRGVTYLHKRGSRLWGAEHPIDAEGLRRLRDHLESREFFIPSPLVQYPAMAFGQEHLGGAGAPQLEDLSHVCTWQAVAELSVYGVGDPFEELEGVSVRALPNRAISWTSILCVYVRVAFKRGNGGGERGRHNTHTHNEREGEGETHKKTGMGKQTDRQTSRRLPESERKTH
jgi:hypothetical protein